MFDRFRGAGSSKIPDKTVVTKARSGEIVLLAPTLFIHIKTQHEKGGLGSAFLKVPSAKELKTIISWMNLKVAGRGDGLYEFLHSRKIAGWDLVKSIKDARKLKDAVETTVEKEERGQPVEVPGVRTSQPISDFETSFMTFVIRPTPPAYLPDDVKGNEKLVSAAQEGKIYSVLSVWPGAAVIYGEPVPPASQWNGRYAVIIPDGGGGGSGSKVNDDRKPYKNLKELLKDVSGNEWSRVSEKLPIQRVWKEEDNGRNIEISVSIINRNNIRMNINDLDAKDVHSEAHFHIDAHLINGIIQGFHIRTRMIPTDLLGDPKVASMIDSKLANKIRSGKTLTPEEQSMLDQVDIPKSKWSGKELLKKVLDFYEDAVKAIEEDYMTGNHLVSINNYINKYNLPLPEGVVSKGEEYERGGESTAGSALIVAENTIKGAIRNGMWHGVVLGKLGIMYSIRLDKFYVKKGKVRRIAFKLVIGEKEGALASMYELGKNRIERVGKEERLAPIDEKNERGIIERIEKRVNDEDAKIIKRIEKKANDDESEIIRRIGKKIKKAA